MDNRSAGMNKKNTNALASVAVLLLSAMPAMAAEWQLSAGATLEAGGAIEVSRQSRGWEAALGLVTRQQVLINYITPTCPYEGAPGALCSRDVQRSRESVAPFAYMSLQRRFEFRDGARFRPRIGIGLMGTSETNEYVSTPVNFSLSAGFALGDALSVEWRHFSNANADGPNLGQDALLLRWRFD